jgi:hypothetical protein
MASRADLAAALSQAADGLASNLNVHDEIATMIGGRAVRGSAPFSATAEADALADRLADAPPSRHGGDAHVDVDYSGTAAPDLPREPATRTRAVVSASRSLAASLACAGGLSAAEVAAMVSADAALADEAVVARADLIDTATSLAQTLGSKKQSVFSLNKQWINRGLKSALSLAREEHAQHRGPAAQ